jgi:exonuclease SbcC
MSPRLHSVTITDFRSIRGNIIVPLDAPVVLIHGANGAGKTSILSAIELALTGAIASLRRIESDYTAHLVHKRATQASVKLRVEGLSQGPLETSFTLTAGGAVRGTPLKELARCEAILAQDGADTAQLRQLEQDLARARVRSNRLDQDCFRYS